VNNASTGYSIEYLSFCEFFFIFSKCQHVRNEVMELYDRHHPLAP
jgi:hypothetical protein